MIPPTRPRIPPRDRWILLAASVASLLIAAPGVHLFELWLPPRAALFGSHGLALLGLALTVGYGRVCRARAARAISPPG